MKKVFTWDDLIEKMSKIKGDEKIRFEDVTGSYILMREDEFDKLFASVGNSVAGENNE